MSMKRQMKTENRNVLYFKYLFCATCLDKTPENAQLLQLYFKDELNSFLLGFVPRLLNSGFFLN